MQFPVFGSDVPTVVALKVVTRPLESAKLIMLLALARRPVANKLISNKDFKVVFILSSPEELGSCR
jgi:hypothetical protein